MGHTTSESLAVLQGRIRGPTSPWDILRELVRIRNSVMKEGGLIFLEPDEETGEAKLFRGES